MRRSRCLFNHSLSTGLNAWSSIDSCRRPYRTGLWSNALNPDLALDVLAGPLYWRLAVVHQPLSDAEELVQLAHMVIGAFTCVSGLPGDGKSGRATN
jgi:hypothetical protein